MNNKGITLIEILITALIGTIIFGSTIYFIAQSNKVLDASMKQSFAHSNAMRMLSMLQTDIREGAIVRNGTWSAALTGYTYDCKIINTDGSEHNWNILRTTDSEGVDCYRITRDGVVLQYIGEIADSYNYTVFMVKADNEGEYYSADIVYRIYSEGTHKDMRSKVYCRHDWSGYFDPTAGI